MVGELIGDGLADALLDSAERAESLNSIRRDMRTDLGALNRVLTELGRDPLHFPELHRAALDSFLAEHRISLLGELRRRFLPLFEERSDLAGYTAARDFGDVDPDPAWLDEHEAPTESMLRERLAAWLSSKGELSRETRTLEPVDQVRAANQSLLDRCLPAIADVVRAFSAKRDTEAPDVWADLQQVRDKLGESGALDFIELDELDLLEWIVALGLWPAEMPETLEHSELGLLGGGSCRGGGVQVGVRAGKTAAPDRSEFRRPDVRRRN